MRSSSLKNWTWQLFKTERFAATLFPAKRKTTWISHCSGSSNTQNLRETECTGTAPSQLHLPYYPHATPCSRWCIVVPPNSVAALCCLCLPPVVVISPQPLALLQDGTPWSISYSKAHESQNRRCTSSKRGYFSVLNRAIQSAFCVLQAARQMFPRSVSPIAQLYNTSAGYAIVVVQPLTGASNHDTCSPDSPVWC